MTTIRTDHKWHETISWFDLTPKEQKEFDWMHTSDTVTPEDADFIRYKRWVYYIGDFMRIEHNPDLAGWDGYHDDTYFSCIVIKFNNDGQYMIGFAYS